jgi:hypothetical protein
MSEDRPLTPEETARVVELAMHFAREPADVQDLLR